MLGRIHRATSSECERIWPAVDAERLFPNAAAFWAYRDANAWCIRVGGRGESAVLGRWKRDVDVLAMRGVWAAERNVPAFVADAREQAAEHGYSRVMSPLLPLTLLDRYFAAGMHVAEKVVAIQGHPELVLPADPPLGVTIREGTPADLPAAAAIDAASFDEFWRWGEADLEGFLADESFAVAQARGGALIGYTLATVSRGAATLTRLAVAPQARRAGLGRALLAEVAHWATKSGAITLSLCTQEDNPASRALYASAGLAELEDRYALAIGDAP
jgi:ribosomal protein S18 acetylase RimI-like enzyme